MKRKILLSLAGTFVLLFVWAGLVIATSQDIVHEGPRGFWFAPVESWIQLLQSWGWSHWLSGFGGAIAFVLGICVVFGPFIVAAFVLAHIAVTALVAHMAQPNNPADACRHR